ncbi:MAG: 23S rRNA (adenine(2030)-N(6))-methyltransferase RlmJ [Pseudomonadales bacterium]|jgi:23S rRNA (adenine2030-N6)-methyltransferase|nr:23S rRNA (adenine(2030)-N(6))-methyltransferase RlmJ [Pseudomonadales bacterium]
MLSYRHAFHAGNFADVLKHLVLCGTLRYATSKDAPLLYLDTHAGAGRYRLDAAEARRTGEAASGILQLDLPALAAACSEAGAALLRDYHAVLTPFLTRGWYPGSPLIAAALLRRNDHLHLCELHPADHELLRKATEGDRRIRVEKADGLERAVILLPPVQKRAVVLIDPSYEVKQDYRAVVRTLSAIHQRMPAAQVLLWYPVVEREYITRLIASLRHSPLRDVWQVELGLRADTPGHGMSGCGLILVNPPWTLPAALRELLPPLLANLGSPAYGHWHVERLIDE